MFTAFAHVGLLSPAGDNKIRTTVSRRVRNFKSTLYINYYPFYPSLLQPLSSHEVFFPTTSRDTYNSIECIYIQPSFIV